MFLLQGYKFKLNLHKIKNQNYEIFTEVGKDSNTEFHQKFYKKLNEGREELTDAYESFVKDELSKYIKGPFVYQKTPIHNSFAIIFLEGGFISFILFSSIWLLTLYFLFKNKPWFKGKAEIAIIISYLFYISTISNVYDRMFWLIVVYVFAMIDKNRFTYFYKLKAT